MSVWARKSSVARLCPLNAYVSGRPIGSVAGQSCGVDDGDILLVGMSSGTREKFSCCGIPVNKPSSTSEDGVWSAMSTSRSATMGLI